MKRKVSKWWTRTRSRAWDVWVGLWPLAGITAAFLLFSGTLVVLHLIFRASRPLFSYSLEAPLYLYSAVAQSLAAYVTLGLTALFIASQVLGRNYSWGFTRLLVSQRNFQIALGLNLAVIIASLSLLATPDWWGVVAQGTSGIGQQEAYGNTPLIIVVMAVVAVALLTQYVIGAVLSLEPRRFVRQSMQQAKQVVTAGYSDMREEYVGAVIRVLRDTGMLAPERTRRLEETIKLAANALTGIRREIFGREKWEKTQSGEESETCHRIRWALIDIGTTGVWTEEVESEHARSQVSNLLISVWWPLGWEAYRLRNLQAWEDVLTVVYVIAKERRLAHREYWFARFKEAVVNQLSCLVGEDHGTRQITDGEKPLLKAAMKYGVRAAFDAVDEGQIGEAGALFFDIWIQMWDRKPTVPSSAQEIALSFTSCVASIGAYIVHKKDAEVKIREFLPHAGRLLSEMVTLWQVHADTLLEQALDKFSIKRNRFTQALSDRLFADETPLETPGRTTGGVDPTPYLGDTMYVLLRCYLEVNEPIVLGFETMQFSESAAHMSSTVTQIKEGILERWSEPMKPLLGDKELSSLLDVLADKLGNFERQRERDEWAAIHEVPFSLKLVGEFKEGVKQQFRKALRVTNLLNRVDSLADGHPLTVKLNIRGWREAFVEVETDMLIRDLDNEVSRAFAAREDYRFLSAITEFAKAELGHSDLTPQDISEMRLMLEEIYEGPACVICSSGLHQTLVRSPDFRPWYRERLPESPAYFGHLGQAEVYLTQIEPAWAVSFIKEQIGDLAVTKPLQISDPVDMPWDAETGTRPPMVSVELSEELQLALRADGKPRVWDLSEWETTDQAQ